MGAAEAQREWLDLPRRPTERDGYERAVAALRLTLGDEAFARVRAEGREMTYETAMALALAEPGSAPPPK